MVCGLTIQMSSLTPENTTSLEKPSTHQATAGPSSNGVPSAGPLPDRSPIADPSYDRHSNAGPSSDEPPNVGPSLATVRSVASTPVTTVIRDLIKNISPLLKTSTASSKSIKQESAVWVSSSPYKNALTKKGEASNRQCKG